MSRTSSSRTRFTTGWFALGLFVASCAPELTFERGGAPPPPPTPAQETEAVVRHVEGSGPLPKELEATVQTAADQLFAQTFASNPAVERKQLACYAGGCLERVIYKDQCALFQATERISKDPTAPLFRAPWIIQKTPPLARADGRLDVIWALLISNPRDERFRTALLPPQPGPPTIVPPPACAQTSNTARTK
jgi:hypothetical protein